jgi:hypothetical protein
MVTPMLLCTAHVTPPIPTGGHLRSHTALALAVRQLRGSFDYATQENQQLEWPYCTQRACSGPTSGRPA